MSLVPRVNQQFVDANGVPLSGGTLTFSVTGTATAKDTYSDAALSSANSNPITLNSLGYPANGSGDEINVFGSGTYRVVLKDADGNTIWSLDELDAGSGVDNATIVNLGTAGGSANALTFTPSTPLASYTDFFGIFKAASNNTDAITINISAIGAQAGQIDGNALVADDIVAGRHYFAYHDGTQFQVGSLSNAYHLFETTQIESFDAGAGVIEALTLARRGGSQVANDLLNSIVFLGQDDASADVKYADIVAEVDDPSAGAEYGNIHFRVMQNGTKAVRMHLGAGLFTPNASSGDQGADTANFKDYYDDGTEISTIYYSRTADYESGEQTVTADTLLTLAHSLGAMPSFVELRLRCKTADLNYAADEEVISPEINDSATDVGYSLSADSTNIYITQGATIPLLDKSTFNKGNITVANWRWLVRAWT